MQIPVFVGQHAGKLLLTGTMSAREIIAGLMLETMTVNPNAQRSLARGVGKEPTKQLLEDDRAHRTPRMRELVGFYLRVMECAEQGDYRQGFLGAIQLVIPERFTGARLRWFSEDSAPTSEMRPLLRSLGTRKLATLEAEPRLGEAIFEIGDGQGRCFAFYSFQRAVADAIGDRRSRLAQQEAPDPAAQRELAKLENLQERIRNFLATTDMTFVCYAREVLEDGRIVGLGEEAEKRLYIESNALNSQATKEEVIKYESFSPVIVALQEERADPTNLWMDAEFVEEDSKVVSRSTGKLFTLSALTQAYSYSMLGDGDPVTNPNAEMFRRVAERIDFVRAYWQRVSSIFQPLWLPPDAAHPGEIMRGEERLSYLEARRVERNVAFQAVFLHALGKLGFVLGEASGWDPGTRLLTKLEALRTRSFRGYTGRDVEGSDRAAYDPTWRLAMMRPRVDHDTGDAGVYVFEHTSETIRRAERALATMIGLGHAKAPDAVA